MNREMLYRQSGFTDRAVKETLTAAYRPYVSAVLSAWLENPEAVQWQPVIEQMMRRLPEFPMTCDLQHLAYDCLRKQVTVLLRELKIRPKADRKLLAVYQQQLSAGYADSCIAEELDRILSCCKRTAFLYFLGRYYYFDDAVPYDEKAERAVAKLFQGQGDMRELAAWTHMHPHGTDAGSYMQMLDHLSLHFIAQIPQRGELTVHPDILGYEGAQIRQRAHRKALPWILLIFVLFTLALFWKCVSV